jgi:hypothetical protein
MPSIEARVSVRDSLGPAFEIALAPRLGKLQYDAVYTVSSWPEARDLLPGKTFVR